MFGFGKKEAKTPEERLAELQKKRDWAGLVKAYYELGVSAAFSINRLPQDFSVSRHASRENLAFAMKNIVRLWKAAGGR